MRREGRLTARDAMWGEPRPIYHRVHWSFMNATMDQHRRVYLRYGIKSIEVGRTPIGGFLSKDREDWALGPVSEVGFINVCSRSRQQMK